MKLAGPRCLCAVGRDAGDAIKTARRGPDRLRFCKKPDFAVNCDTVGSVPLTPELVASIGVDDFAEDAVGTARKALELLNLS